MSNKVIILTAPSGSGKTTLARELMKIFPFLEFSISATTRPPRSYEKNGLHYYFLSQESFQKKIASGAFCEYEEVYENQFYGTLNTEIERIWNKGMMVLFDVDVKGALTLQKKFDNKLSFFIQAPSMEVLKERLQSRGTETADSLSRRLERASYELSLKNEFDQVIINDNIDDALKILKEEITKFGIKNN